MRESLNQSVVPKTYLIHFEYTHNVGEKRPKWEIVAGPARHPSNQECFHASLVLERRRPREVSGHSL